VWRVREEYIPLVRPFAAQQFGALANSTARTTVVSASAKTLICVASSRTVEWRSARSVGYFGEASSLNELSDIHLTVSSAHAHATATVRSPGPIVAVDPEAETS